MTKLTNKQLELLQKLNQAPNNGRHHAKDGCDQRTVAALVKREYAEVYHVNEFLHGAIRITDKGKDILAKHMNKQSEPIEFIKKPLAKSTHPAKEGLPFGAIRITPEGKDVLAKSSNKQPEKIELTGKPLAKSTHPAKKGCPFGAFKTVSEGKNIFQETKPSSPDNTK